LSAALESPLWRAFASAISVARPLSSEAANSRVAAMQTKRARGIILRPVAAVNADIALGEVARPEARPTFALSADSEANFAIGGFKFLFQLRLVIVRGEAAFAHRNSLQVNVCFRRVERYARVACGGEDAAPVGVAAGDRRFHKW